MDFKEQAIYEFEKDSSFSGAKEFKFKIKQKYGFEPSSDLYRRITNYQIRKYGEPLSNSKGHDYISKYSIKRNAKRRRIENEYIKNRKITDRLIERVNNEKN